MHLAGQFNSINLMLLLLFTKYFLTKMKPFIRVVSSGMKTLVLLLDWMPNSIISDHTSG